MNKITVKQPLEKSVVSIGQIYKGENSFYILVKCDSRPNKITVGLIDFVTGNLWTDTVAVEHCGNITEKEWKQIQSSGTFELFNGIIEINTND